MLRPLLCCALAFSLLACSRAVSPEGGSEARSSALTPTSAPPVRAADLNTTLSTHTGSNPHEFLRFGPHVYFAAFDPLFGDELFRTDGTANGTVLAVDLHPAGSGNPYNLRSLGARMVFVANDGEVEGLALFSSDGTAAGTVKLRGVFPDFSSTSYAVLGGNRLVFSGATVASGSELWITDGTQAGTQQVVELAPGPASFNLGNFQSTNSLVFFTWIQGGTSRLARTDGTAAGTFELTLPSATTSPFITSMAAQGSTLYFTWDNQTWATDGTQAGTQRVSTTAMTDLSPSSSGVWGRCGDALCRSRAPDAGVDTIALLPANSIDTAPGVALRDGGFLFALRDPNVDATDLYRSNGTDGGTFSIARLSFPGGFVDPRTEVLPSGAVFQGERQSKLRAFFTSGQVVTQLTELEPRITANRRSMYADGTQVWLAAGIDGGPGELFVTDGTVGGTQQVADIARPQTSARLSSLAPRADGGVVLIGSPGTAFAVFSFTPDAGLTQLSNFSPTSELTRFRNGWLYTCNAVPQGTEPCFTDGVTAGVFFDVASGAAASFPSRYLSLGAVAMFNGSQLGKGEELVLSDGTDAGTSFLDLRSGPGSSFPRFFSQADDGGAFFVADTTYANELWMTDGTPAGTRAAYSHDPDGGMVFTAGVGLPDRFVFSGAVAPSLGGAPFEPWVLVISDGGFTQLADINDAGSSEPRSFTRLGAKVFFTASSPATGREPWVTDGTPAGTLTLGDLAAGAENSLPQSPLVEGARLFFSAFTLAEGRELWVTDGTPAGTRLVMDVRPGAASSYATPLLAIGNGQILFAANDGTSGREVWVSDGTSAGTFRLGDIAAGALPSNPRLAVRGEDDQAWLLADDGSGEDLWRINLLDMGSGGGPAGGGGGATGGGGGATGGGAAMGGGGATGGGSTGGGGGSTGGGGGSTGGGAATGGGGGGSATGGGGGSMSGCTCQASSDLLFALGALLTLARRRVSLSSRGGEGRGEE